MNKNKIICALQSVIFRLQTTKYFVGRRRLKYQPLPWLGIEDAGRGIGTVERMKTIAEYLKRTGVTEGNVLDIGCNVGYFSLSLKEKDFYVYGVDNNIRSLDIAQYASRRMKGDGGVFVPLHLKCDSKSVHYLPYCDVTLCMSVWHHWLKQYSYKDATSILRTLYAHTKRILFFESGELEMTPDYELPFRDKDPKQWLGEYLTDTCEGAQVEWLGVHKAFAPKTTETISMVQRNLFAVVKGGEFASRK